MCAEGVLWAVAAGFLTKAGEPTCAIGDTQRDTRLGFLTLAHAQKKEMSAQTPRTCTSGAGKCTGLGFGA